LTAAANYGEHLTWAITVHHFVLFKTQDRWDPSLAIFTDFRPIQTASWGARCSELFTTESLITKPFTVYY
jgi:hypothetical protein